MVYVGHLNVGGWGLELLGLKGFLHLFLGTFLRFLCLKDPRGFWLGKNNMGFDGTFPGEEQFEVYFLRTSLYANYMF